MKWIDLFCFVFSLSLHICWSYHQQTTNLDKAQNTTTHTHHTHTHKKKAKMVDFRRPCPDRIVDDIGGEFTIGAIGGTVWHTIKGARNAAKSARFCGSIEAARHRAPVLGGDLLWWFAGEFGKLRFFVSKLFFDSSPNTNRKCCCFEGLYFPHLTAHLWIGANSKWDPLTSSTTPHVTHVTHSSTKQFDVNKTKKPTTKHKTKHNDDPYNAIASGFCTGAARAGRGGVRTPTRSGIVGGVLLGLIEGAQILLQRAMTKVQEQEQERERQVTQQEREMNRQRNQVAKNNKIMKKERKKPSSTPFLLLCFVSLCWFLFVCLFVCFPKTSTKKQKKKKKKKETWIGANEIEEVNRLLFIPFFLFFFANDSKHYFKYRTIKIQQNTTKKKLWICFFLFPSSFFCLFLFFVFLLFFFLCGEKQKKRRCLCWRCFFLFVFLFVCFLFVCFLFVCFLFVGGWVRIRVASKNAIKSSWSRDHFVYLSLMVSFLVGLDHFENNFLEYFRKTWQEPFSLVSNKSQFSSCWKYCSVSHNTQTKALFCSCDVSIAKEILPHFISCHTESAHCSRPPVEVFWMCKETKEHFDLGWVICQQITGQILQQLPN